MPDLQTSNTIELRYEIEASPGTLPGSPEWTAINFNGFNDFGAQYNRKRRELFRKDRMQRKGDIVGLDVAAGFGADMTDVNWQELLQVFLFADWDEVPTTAPRNGSATTITNVDGAVGETYDAASGLSIFVVGHLLLAENFTNAANNGVKRATAVSATDVTVAEDLVDETPPASASLTVVGFEFPTAEVDVDASGNLPKLARAGGGSVDFTTIGLQAGDHIFVGGDAASEKFVNSENNGWARVKSITSTEITLDKTQQTMTTETGSGLTIRIFFGHRINNEPSENNIKTRTVQFERQLGDDGNGQQSDYVEGSYANELTFNIPSEDFVTLDMSFLALTYTKRNGSTGLKSGTRPTLTEGDPYDTASDFRRLKLSKLDATDSAATATLTWIQDLTLTVANNAEATKALTKLGNANVSHGDIVPNGSLNGLFRTIDVLNEVANNSDMTLDGDFAANNRGWGFDIPRIEITAPSPTEERNREIKQEVTYNAVIDDTLQYAIRFFDFKYLPNAAQA